jgi:hypothetical protein
MVTFIQYPFGVSMGLIRASLLVLILRLFGMVAGKNFRYLGAYLRLQQFDCKMSGTWKRL